MRAKPDMKPWVNRVHKNQELLRSGTTTRAFTLRLGSAAPLGLIYAFTTNQLLASFDVLTSRSST